MNASELHDLVAPLWERVPELRPHGLILVPTGEYGAASHEWQIRKSSYELPDSCVAALIRVAVEDWLESQVGMIAIEEQSGDWKVFWAFGWEHYEESASGPTLMHALVAAAHEVADSDGGAKVDDHQIVPTAAALAIIEEAEAESWHLGFGPGHIVIEDLNLEDGHIDFCLRACDEWNEPDHPMPNLAERTRHYLLRLRALPEAERFQWMPMFDEEDRQ